MTKRKTLIIVVILAIIVLGFLVLKRGTATAPNGSKNTTTQAPSFNKTLYSTSDPTSIWVVVNKKRSLNPVNYAPTDLVSVGNGQYMRQEAATALQQMFVGASAAGLTLQPLSGYRSYANQQSVYSKEVANYGQSVADTESAKPGTSEHQTGFAIDLGGGGCGIEDCFGNTAEGKWVAANAYQYGFIVRYTSGNETVTGYRAEPWHVRYVGAELSKELHDTYIPTLEQFFNL